MFLNHAFCHFENFEEFRRKLERNLEKDISKRTFLFRCSYHFTLHQLHEIMCSGLMVMA